MPGEPSPLVLLSLLTSLLSAAVLLDVVRRRPARGVFPFAVMLLGTSAYTLFYAVGLASTTLEDKLLWTRFMYLSSLLLPPGLLGFANRYTERKGWLKWYTPVLLAIEPLITLTLVWTNDAHHWMWTQASLVPYTAGLSTLQMAHGPWFSVHALYSYGLIAWAFALLAGAFVRSSRLFRRPLAILLAGLCLPLFAYTFVVLGMNPVAPVDPMPFATVLGVILAAWSLRGFRLLDLLPVARHTLLEQINEGVIVVNAEGYLIDANPAAVRLTGQAQVVGQPAALLLPFYDELQRRHPDASQIQVEIVWPVAGSPRYFDVQATALHDRHGRFGGRLLVLHDTTARKEAEDQARRRSQELAQLYDLTLELTTVRDLKTLLRLVVQRATGLLGASSGVIHLYRPEHDDLVLSVARDEDQGVLGSVLKRGEGLAGRVLESGQVALVDDYRNWPGRSTQYDPANLGSVIAVPMRWEGGMVGVLALGREAGRPYSAEEVRVLTLFANQAALVVARTQLYDAAQKELAERQRTELELQQRSRELARLYDTALEVSSQLDLPRLLEAITARAVQLLHASTGDLSLYRLESDDLQSAVLLGVGPGVKGAVLRRGEGLSGKVLASGTPLAVEDYATWPGRAPAYNGLPFGPMIAVPLKWGERILGTIAVALSSCPAFSEAEVLLLSLFAAQAAVAIENARLYADMQRELAERRLAEERLQRRSEELATLNDTVLEVASRLDLDQLLPIIVQRAALLLHGTGCGMYLYQPATDDLQYVVAYGLAEDFIGHSLQRGEGISGKVLDSGEPLAVDDYGHWAGRSPRFEGRELGAMVAVPVKWGDRVLGVIDLQRDPGQSFTAEDVRLLTLFANQAAIALANAQLYEAARHELKQRENTEGQLRESERQYRAVVEDQTELIYRFTPDRRITFANEAASRFLGCPVEEIIGQDWAFDVPVEERPALQQALDSIRPDAPVVTLENRVRGGDGQLHWFQWTDRGVFAEDGTLVEYQSVGRDVGERKHSDAMRAALEQQLQQAQRMEAVGVLAGGVAHEFNNMLTVIQGNVELSLADLDPAHPARESLGTVLKTAERAAALTRQLLAFSRREVLETRPVDLNAVVSSFARILKPALGDGIPLELQLDARLKPVPADARAIEQVLMNLALNARDAMPGGGRLRIATAMVRLDDEFCSTRTNVKPGQYARLTVSDTGVGMDADTLRQIFEPFFTTKEVGKGTGLGLAVVYGIIRQHGGLIEAHSRVGQGSTFDVYLPFAQRA